MEGGASIRRGRAPGNPWGPRVSRSRVLAASGPLLAAAADLLLGGRSGRGRRGRDHRRLRGRGEALRVEAAELALALLLELERGHRVAGREVGDQVDGLRVDAGQEALEGEGGGRDPL